LPKDDLVGWMGAFAEQLGHLWRADPPDVVHAHFWMSAMASLPPARELGIPLAVTFHALGVVKRRHQGVADTSPPQRISVEQDLARQADMVIATSQEEVDELVQMGMDRRRAAIIPCGVDLDRFRPDGPNAPRPDGRRRVVAVSRFVARKGLADLIDAVALSDPATELVIAGGPPAMMLHDDPEACRLAARVRRLGLDDRVYFLGAVERTSVPALLRSADVAAMCPWYEPFGIVALEAMACGVPVVASDVGGLRETVLHGTTGLRVPPRRPDLIAEALQHLLHHPKRRALAVAAARRAHRFSWPRVAARTLAELTSLTCTAARAPLGGDGTAREWSV
jgi:glycosyltransferase involved in cell wall biosynthesis